MNTPDPLQVAKRKKPVRNRLTIAEATAQRLAFDQTMTAIRNTYDDELKLAGYKLLFTTALIPVAMIVGIVIGRLS